MIRLSVRCKLSSASLFVYLQLFSKFTRIERTSNKARQRFFLCNPLTLWRRIFCITEYKYTYIEHTASINRQVYRNICSLKTECLYNARTYGGGYSERIAEKRCKPFSKLSKLIAPLTTVKRMNGRYKCESLAAPIYSIRVKQMESHFITCYFIFHQNTYWMLSTPQIKCAISATAHGCA